MNIGLDSMSIVGGFRITFSNELPDHEVFLLEPFLPAPEIIALFIAQVLQVIQGSMQIFREHLFIETLTCKPARSIPTGKVFVGTALEMK